MSSNLTEESSGTRDHSEIVNDELAIKTHLDNDVEDLQEFKKPILIGPRKGLHKFSKLKPPEPDAPPVPEAAPTPEDSKKVVKSPAEQLKDQTTPLPYKEPKWSAVPDNKYYLEVLKAGSIVENFELRTSCFVFGRATSAGCVLAHPSISRYHAVLQYGQMEPDDTPGFYLYDLNSTHGTFFNKLKIKPNIYVRLHVGHMVKLGLSSRMFILQGPPDDIEPESELSVTELKKERLKEKLAAQLASTLPDTTKEDEGIDWGMGEDADEETDLSHNPFAAAPNEEMYLDDPKKTLRGWFEREGLELSYDVQEKGYAQYVCRVSLPVDDARGQSVVAEAVVKGKKKEAVVQCALEACRILDQHGLLRQSNHESRKKKKKDWEVDDFYDSDEDTFLDRTGTVERKRQKRMQEAGATQVVHTYAGLLSEHRRITEEVERLQESLATATTPVPQPNATTDDDLDLYMAGLAANSVDKANINKLKGEISKLKLDEGRIRTLANIARPAGSAEIVSPWPSGIEDGRAPESVPPPTKPPRQLPIIGKRRLTRKPLPPKAAAITKTVRNTDEEEFDSD